jgi:hypothetical protein
MFTTGSKLFLGAGVAAAVAAVLYGVLEGGALGTTGLTFASVVAFFLAGISLAIRDGNVSAMDVAALHRTPAAAPAPRSSMWPPVAALGAVLVVVGLVTYPVVFVFGLIALIVAAAEWMVQAWSERASGDPQYNAAVRGRLAHPLEFPVLAAIGGAVLIYSFSRIMLFLSKTGGPVVFGVIALLLLVGGFIIAFKPSLRTGAIAAVCTIAALGLVTGGIVAAIDGERDIEVHETTGDLADHGGCESTEETHADENASQTVAATANLTAELILREDGTMVARNQGIQRDLDRVVVQRANVTNVRFRNESSEPRRLVLNAGTQRVDPTDAESEVEPVQRCTALAEEGGSQFLTFTRNQSSANVDVPMEFVVPGVEGARVEVMVP